MASTLCRQDPRQISPFQMDLVCVAALPRGFIHTRFILIKFPLVATTSSAPPMGSISVSVRVHSGSAAARFETALIQTWNSFRQSWQSCAQPVDFHQISGLICFKTLVVDRLLEYFLFNFNYFNRIQGQKCFKQCMQDLYIDFRLLSLIIFST